MDLLAGYTSDPPSSDDGEPASAPPPPSRKLAVNSAPSVRLREEKTDYQDVHNEVVEHNPDYEAMWAPMVGPANLNPFNRDGLQAAQKNILTGYVEGFNVNHHTFDLEFNNFMNNKQTTDPTDRSNARLRQANRASDQKPAKRKRVDRGDLSGEYLGPWAGFEGENKPIVQEPTELTEEQKKIVAEQEEKKKKAEQEREEATKEPETKSTFHGESQVDWAGRSWVEAPKHLKPHDEQCYLPKKQIHTWTGHNKGVNAIRFFPKHGHLLLSASMDCKVKIWDVYNERRCLRTYIGHDKSVRDIDFSFDGRKFLTCSYDRWIRLWDTETGQCIQSWTSRKIPYCVKFHPDENKQDQLLSGGSDKKVLQYSTKTENAVQEYDQHLGAVNTVTFVDNNRRFVSSSDDKTMRVWEWGIPVTIKYISDPAMHSMPAITIHPSGNWFAAQSLDNQILLYSAKDKFKLNRKKRFMGHVCSGYAIRPNFSADGRFCISGDSAGKLWIWDWKSSKCYKKFDAHDKVLIDCAWHPIEQSRVATASWDGTIKYWD